MTNRVESPCVRNCCLNLQDVCMGCFRSLEEITAWGMASTEEQLAILQRAKERQKGQQGYFQLHPKPKP